MIEYLFDHHQPLIIVDDDFNGVKNENTIYWSSINVPLGCISIPLEVDKKGEELKKRYIEFINEISNRKVNGAYVKEQLTVSGFSFWWSSLISEKSIWKSTSIFESFKYFALDEMLKYYAGNEIVIYSNDKLLMSLVRNSIENKNKNKNKNININCIKRTFFKKKFQSLIPHWVKAMGYWGHSVYKYRTVLFNRAPLNKNILNNNLNIIGYSLGLSIEKLKVGEVSSNYWNGAQNVINDRDVNWLLIYIPSKDFPTLKKLLSYRDSFVKEGNNNLNLLEEFYSPQVAFIALLTYLKLAYRSRRLSQIFKDSEVEKLLLKADWDRSFTGSSAMDACIKFALIAKAISCLNLESSKSFYVYENQPWEIMLLSCWRKKTDSPIFGFQHASGKYYDLRPFNSDDLGKPDKLIVIGEAAKQELLNFGYDKEKIIVAESIRNLYLSKYLGKKEYSNKKNNVLLVITDYLYGVSDCQLKLLAEAWSKVCVEFSRIIIKPHPGCEVNTILKNYALLDDTRIEVVSTDLSQLWSECSVVYTSNITGASLDSAYVGLPTIVNLCPDEFNMSPLRGVENVSFVATKDDFEKALYFKEHPKIGENFLCLDKKISTWKKLFQ